MSTPFHVPPEQLYQERAEYARKGISRGKPIVAFEYNQGVVLMGENRSASLRKISEIYDRIAFGGVGKLDEYENLRKSGVRYADQRGFAFSREDVSAKSLANEYSTVLGSVFTREMKPFEVEVLVVEVHDDSSAFFQIRYDGSMIDHTHYATIGGESDKLLDTLGSRWKEGMAMDEAVLLGREVLSGEGSIDDLDENSLEIAVLDRSRYGRKFKRLKPEEIKGLLTG